MAAFKGLKIGQDPITIKHWPQILKATIVRDHDRMLFEEVGVVGWGGNSGFHAVNLAAQFGAKKILLVGIDFTVAYGRHWFGSHAYRQNSPSKHNVKRWQKVMDASAQVLAGRGIRVINCSPISTLQAYEKMTFEEALEC